ncbi:uncharacterized protein LOC107494143 [Arachis duranensis]|uniref:Uncharacterized protein LOC107494143 n=1 Tax=Arachis duranensis TaxID=130453 RepID=A0A6P4DXF2_ARADU|nr:uncharacterized protein LOC107494143 [Arachis duranensis]
MEIMTFSELVNKCRVAEECVKKAATERGSHKGSFSQNRRKNFAPRGPPFKRGGSFRRPNNNNNSQGKRREFLDEYFPAEITDRLRKDISCLIQGESETLYEYWKRFRNLLDLCPHHKIDQLVLISYFCQGMKPQDKTLLDAASNSSLTKYKIAIEVWQLITNLAESNRNARQMTNHPKAITEVSSSSETAALTKTLRTTSWRLQMLITTVRIKGTINNAVIITKVETTIKVGMTIPTKDGATIPTRDREIIPTKDGGTTTTKEAETMVEIKEPPSTPNNQPSSSSTLPSQPLPNPKGGINAITLRSETTLQERSPEEPSSREDIQVEDIVEVEDVEEEDEVQDTGEEEVAQPRSGVSKKDDVVREPIPIPFPHLARRTKKQVGLDPKMVDIFKMVEVAIPLFDAIRQVPKYDNFLKDLCMNKDKINDLETIPLDSSSSTLMGAIPEKCGDPDACITIMPLSVYDTLRLSPLKRSAARFVLADKSIISVVGIAKDVLVSSKGRTFSIDFYILEIPPSDSRRPSSIPLGRPFLKTSRFKLDAFLGTYSFEIDGRAVTFNLDEVMKHPPEDNSIFQCDIIDNGS